MSKKSNTVLGEYVYQQILNMILSGRIKCGEKIPEQALSEELGVSRTPMREAIIRLANDGILNVYPKRYAEVITFDEKYISDLGKVRLYMDTLAAQLAIENGSNREFAALKEIAEKCRQATLENNTFERIKYGSDFHLSLAEISRNKILLDVQKSLYLKTQLLQTTVLTDHQDEIDNNEEHFLIIEKLYERNVEEVTKVVQKHIMDFYGFKSDGNITIPII